MQVEQVNQVPGRGLVALVAEVPKGVKVGCLVHQRDKAWKIVGIEPSERRSVFVLQPLHHGEPPVPGALDL